MHRAARARQREDVSRGAWVAPLRWHRCVTVQQEPRGCVRNRNRTGRFSPGLLAAEIYRFFLYEYTINSLSMQCHQDALQCFCGAGKLCRLST